VSDTYSPINTLKPIAKDVWIVDGPIIRFGMPWPKMPFPTRMTILRLSNDRLFIHSPTALTDDLRKEIAAIGRPSWFVGPNRLHYWWIPDWKNAYRDAEVYLAPHIKEQAGKHINDGFKPLDRNQGYPWDESIATLTVSGSFMTEVEFFHRPSRSLILTDFIENFEPEKLDSPLERWLCRLGGVLSPNGGMPRDMRMTFRRQRPALKAAITTMISWNPERIVIAHGRWFERDGADALRRSFAWVLDRP
jgi:hypothetical protein